MDEDKQGAIPPEVKNAIFLGMFLGINYYLSVQLIRNREQITRLLVARKPVPLPFLDAFETNL